MNGDKRCTDAQLRRVVYVADSGIHGTGLFASREIAAGEYIGTFHGPPATRDGMYVLWVFDEDDPRQPVGRSGRNLLRYINHDSPGNAAFDGFDLYACCVIGCDQEITIDYASGP